MIRDGDTDTVTATRLNRFVSCGALCLSRSECLIYSPVLISTVIKGFSQMRASGDLIRVLRYNIVRRLTTPTFQYGTVYKRPENRVH